MDKIIESDIIVIDNYTKKDNKRRHYLDKIFFCMYCLKIKIEDVYYFFNDKFCCGECLKKNK